MTNFDWTLSPRCEIYLSKDPIHTDLLHTTQTCEIYLSTLDRPNPYTPNIHWIWRILTGQTCYISPRSEIYWGTDLFHTLDMTNFDWTDLLHTTQMWDLLRYRSIPYTGYDEFWLDRPVTYHPDVRFIEVQSYSIHWIWRILTGQTCYIPPRCEIYWGTDLFHTLDMTNFDWTELLHITQISDLLRYRAIPYTGYDEFWLDRPVTYHQDLWFIEVQSYSYTGYTNFDWTDLLHIARCDIYWGTKLFHILDMTNFEWTDLLQRTHLWDLFKYRSRSIHTLDMNFNWTDLLHITQIWDLLGHRSIPYTGYGEFWLDRPVTYHPDWDLFKYRP